MTTDSAMNSCMIRPFLHGKNFIYNTDKYPFKETIEEIFGVELGKIHTTMGDFDPFSRSNDQSTMAHKVFYANFAKNIKPLYNDFISDVVSAIVPAEFYYQVIPTFRLGLPGNKFVGEYHTDRKYNHQSYELNFNLGLSNYRGKAALKTQIEPGSDEFMLLECPYGQIFSFDHLDCLHGSEINTSNITMASFDFRLAIKELYFDSEAKSINMSKGFKPGAYFSQNVVVPRNQ